MKCLVTLIALMITNAAMGVPITFDFVAEVRASNNANEWQCLFTSTSVCDAGRLNLGDSFGGSIGFDDELVGVPGTPNEAFTRYLDNSGSSSVFLGINGGLEFGIVDIRIVDDGPFNTPDTFTLNAGGSTNDRNPALSIELWSPSSAAITSEELPAVP